jgi:hypothetical protein
MQAGGDRRAAMIAAAVLGVAIVAVAFYFVGRATANAPGAERRGYERGLTAANRELRAGNPRYDRIYNAGFRSGHSAGRAAGLRAGQAEGAEKGEKLGLEKGEKIGTLQGDQEGIRSGAQAALGGFTDWASGVYYIVKLAPGEQDVSFRIDSRKRMDTNRRFAICAENDADVCSKPIAGR